MCGSRLFTWLSAAAGIHSCNGKSAVRVRHCGHLQTGIDFAGAEGANALAVYDGVVSSVTYDQLNGNVVKIDHGNGLVTIYSSLNEPVVTEGQTVTTGTVLGALSTSASKEMSDGSHLHFEVSLNGEVSNPYDYLPTGDK